jgi:hypothetical protein
MKIPDDIPVYGDVDYRGDCPLEELEHVTFFSQLRIRHPHLGRLAIHPPNEGKRHLGKYRQDVLRGMSVGAADIIIPAGRTFVCEMKRRDRLRSTLDDTQLAWLRLAREQGAFVCIALGWEAAFLALDDYLQTIQLDAT